MRDIVVLVKVGARKEKIEVQGDRFSIQVREPAKDNRANARLIAVLARHFRIIESRVRIVQGHHRPKKVIRISDLN